MSISDNYVEQQIFPTEEYSSDDTPPAPALWVDATRVQIVEADTVTTNTYAVPSYVDQPVATLLLARRGNNERKRVTLLVTGQDLAVFADPVQGPIPATIGAVTFFSNAYIIPAGTTLVYEAVAPLYCLSLGATTEYSIVSVLSEGYFRNV